MASKKEKLNGTEVYKVNVKFHISTPKSHWTVVNFTSMIIHPYRLSICIRINTFMLSFYFTTVWKPIFY